jgi:neutral ceramidase
MIPNEWTTVTGRVWCARSIVIGIAVTALCWFAPNVADAQTLQAGAATSNVTPPLGLSIAGSMRDHVGADIHDELHARCLVLDDGSTKLAIVVVDSCMIPREIFDAAKQRAETATGIPASHMLMSATHTHSAPAATPVFQSDPDPEYQAFLTKRIADCVARAHHNLAPAKLGFGSALVEDEVFNRRWKMTAGTVGNNPFGSDQDQAKMNPPRGSEDLVEPWGPVDPEVAILSVQNADGTPLALLANYSLHYVGGVPGDQVSADYFGVFADRIASLMDAEGQDPPFVGILSNGTSGDINNINFRKPPASFQPYEKMTLVAENVANAVHAALDEIEYRSDLTLDAAQTDLSLGVRLPTADDVARAKEIMAAVETPDMRTLQEIYARETVLLSEYPENVPVLVQALRIGDGVIGAIPCEVFVEIGLRFKAASPFASSFIIELANGYNGYLPTPEQHALGGYETWRARSSYLEVDASVKISEALDELAAALHAR